MGNELPRGLRDQIATVGDLEKMKQDLLSEIKKMLTESTGVQKKWLKSDEVKKLLGISTGTLQTLRLNGSLPHSKIGGTLYYDYDGIMKLLDQNAEGGDR